MFFLLLLILPGVRTQDATPQSYLQQHRLPFKAVQFLQHKEHLRQGPILFPNDAPPPPPTPLIVTSRPLSESIARSELNSNNSVAAQSQYHQVTFRPNLLAREKSYEPYSYTLTTVTPEYDFDAAKINEKRVEKYFKDYETKQLPMVDQGKDKVNNNNNTYSKKAQSTTEDSYYDFNEEDNNFDFDFKKLYTKGRKNIESISSEYLEYYPDSKKVQRRQFAHFAINDEYFKIRPSKYNLNKKTNGNAWHRLSEHEKSQPSNSAEQSDDIADILGLPTTRESVMRSVKYDGNAMKSIKINYKMDRRQRKTSRNFGRRGKPQLRVVKPRHEFNNAQRQQQHTASKAYPYEYKDSPDHYYHSKNKGDEHDYNQETNPSDNYAFSYSVKDHKTGDDFSHSQKSTGSATNGEYRVLLPDGRTQIVSYTADENGYKADVRYDEHHNQENSIDFDYDKDKILDNNDRHIAKPHYGHNQDDSEHEDILYRPQHILAPYKANVPKYEHRHVENKNDILYRPQQALAPYKANVPKYEQRHEEDINDYRDKNDDNFQYFNVYPTKAAFVDTTANINDRTLDHLSDNNNDYLEQYNARLENKHKVERAKDDYKFSDELDFSKEVVDYSSELDHTYEPHKSKFSELFSNQNAQAQGQLRPSYDELKALFETNENGRRNTAIPVSTVRPVYAVTPADVVAITPKKPVHNLYTNIKNIVTPAPFIFSTPSPSTPRSYLLSTIANLKHQISLTNKPILSEQYINKINKYLSYPNPVTVN